MGHDHKGQCQDGLRKLGACCRGLCGDNVVDCSVSKLVQEHISRSELRRASRVDKKLMLMCSDPTLSVKDSFQLQDQLGSGAYGCVFRAVDRLTREPVAVKRISKSEQPTEGLRSELETLLRLDHPNIAKLFRVFEDGGALYLVTELCDGGDFGQLLGHETPLDDVQRLFRDVLMAIAYCHERGVAHRDLKFENCLIQNVTPGQRRGKVIDFGFAAMRPPGDDSEAWLSERLGTRFFIAPEIITLEQPYGVRCDCFSLGVMLYVILTNEHPFAERAWRLDSARLFRRIVRGNVRLQPLEDSDVDPLARDFVLALLRTNPEERLDSRAALFHGWLSHSARSRSASGRITRKITRCYSGPRASVTGLLPQIESFGGYTRFERAVLTLVAHRAQEREVAHLRRAFFQLDDGHKGTLSLQELGQGLTVCGHELDDEELARLFGSLDGDGDGKIDYTEWLAATIRPSLLKSSMAIEQLYGFFEDPSEGTVSTQRMRDALGSWQNDDGDELTEEQFKTLMWDIAAGLGEQT